MSIRGEFTERVKGSAWAKELRSAADAVAGLYLDGDIEFVELGNGICHSTPMEVGSVTKGFTGLLLAEAVARGEFVK